MAAVLDVEDLIRTNEQLLPAFKTIFAVFLLMEKNCFFLLCSHVEKLPKSS